MDGIPASLKLLNDCIRKKLHNSLLLNIFPTKFSASGKINREEERVWVGVFLGKLKCIYCTDNSRIIST